MQRARYKQRPYGNRRCGKESDSEEQEEICMGQKKVCVGVVGAGAISDIYLKNMIHRFENLYVKSICAAHLESAQKKSAGVWDTGSYYGRDVR